MDVVPPRPRTPALFVGHGAAVCTTSPADATFRFLRSLASAVSGWHLSGIVVISAHDAGRPLRITGPGPLATIHDHPAHAVYGYRYPGRGTAALSERVREALARSGLDADIDPRRGLDHGAWIPLSLLAPDGQWPVAQLSLDAGRDPDRHVALGRALAPLRAQGILLVGSGALTHNQDVFRRSYFGGHDSGPERFSREFDEWASDLVTANTGAERSRRLCRFEAHPLARQCHPTVEHFLPLLVIAGAAEDERARKLFEGFQHSLSTSALQFG